MIRLFNTLTRKTEEFVPVHKGNVSMYCCGPTVYNFAHIGNLRTYVFEDILRRMFLYNNYKLKHAMNITDVGHLTSDADSGEDKMELGAKREGKTVWQIAQDYTDAFFEDTNKLNIEKPEIVCKATDHISQMITLVKRLESKGLTYVAGGNVYFDTSKFSDYGKMALLKLDDQQSGARIDVDENKLHPRDFVLWFTKSKFEHQEMMWESPWGRGYPGWHIECSAMSMNYLGETFDIHCGGIDHIPVHHTNEIAQSEGATGKKWVNYWLHGEFLIMDKGKMSKSSGEFLTLKVLTDKGYDALDYRYFLLGAHYRTQLTFNYEAMDGAKTARQKLNNKIIELKKSAEESKNPEKKKDYEKKFINAINNDLDMPIALSLIWEVLKNNDLGNKEKLELLFEFDKIYGLGLKAVEEEQVQVPIDIYMLIVEREQARKRKDFATSDRIRDNIKLKGYELIDGVEGVKVKKI